MASKECGPAKKGFDTLDFMNSQFSVRTVPWEINI